MLLPPSSVTVPELTPSSSKVIIPAGDESLTEDYGEANQDARTMAGGVDFFSSLGTERKKPKNEKPDPEKVHFLTLKWYVCFDRCMFSQQLARKSSIQTSSKAFLLISTLTLLLKLSLLVVRGQVGV